MRTVAPSVELLPGSQEAIRLGATTQEIITESQWNQFGQLTRSIDPEGNVSRYIHYPASEPHGAPSESSPFFFSEVPGVDTGGYLERHIVDAEDSPRRTSTQPPARLERVLVYDRVGNVIRIRDPRGVWGELEVNQLNEPVALTRGADIAEAVASGQLITGETTFRYREETEFDHNGRAVRRRVENRDSTTAGVGNFVDRTYAYDILHNLVESTFEADATSTLVAGYRYDENQLLVRTIQPEGNSVRRTYDERNLALRLPAASNLPRHRRRGSTTT